MKAKTNTLAAEIVNNAIEDNAEQANASAKIAMDRIAALVQAMRRAEEAVATADAETKRRKALLLKIEREDLPELLRESGFKEVTLEDNTKVIIADEISCGISEDRSPDAHAWLRDHDLESVIKTLVTVQFGKGEAPKADALYAAMLKRFGDAATQTEKVHPQTLKALLKELMERGVSFPFDLFGVVPYSVAKLSVAKAKKGGKL